MNVYNDRPYLGLGQNGTAEMWRSSNGVNWTPVFSNGLAPNNSMVSAIAKFNGTFYIGVRNVTSGGEVWRSIDRPNWTQVFTGGLNNPNNQRPYGRASAG